MGRRKGDARRYVRAKAQWPVVVTTTTSVLTGETVDVAPTGALILCAEALTLNEGFHLQIHLPDRTRPVVTEARVIWSNRHRGEDGATRTGLGVRFEGMSDEDSRALATAVLAQLEAEGVDAKDLESLRSLLRLA